MASKKTFFKEWLINKIPNFKQNSTIKNSLKFNLLYNNTLDIVTKELYKNLETDLNKDIKDVSGT